MTFDIKKYQNLFINKRISLMQLCTYTSDKINRSGRDKGKGKRDISMETRCDTDDVL